MKPHFVPETDFPLSLSAHVTLLGNYFFNLYLIRGSRESALFETGISAVTDTVISQLESLGIEPDYLIPSHPHSDHITGLPGLTERFPNARVVAAAGAREFLEHPKAGPLLIKEDAFMSGGLRQMGITPGRPPLDTVPDLSGSRAVDSPANLDLGGVSLALHPVEGHSPGNLVGMIQTPKIVFCADSLGFHFPGRGIWPLFFTGADTYLATLRFIKELDPVLLCPAHQGPLEGEAAGRAIQTAIGTTQSFIRRVTHTPLSDDDLLADLFQKSYRDEFSLYTPDNISNCNRLLIKRARQMA